MSKVNKVTKTIHKGISIFLLIFCTLLSSAGAMKYTIARPPIPKARRPSVQILPCRFKKYPV